MSFGRDTMAENVQRKTEETFIGFRKKPEGLEGFLKDKGYERHHPRNEPSSPDERYRCTDPFTGGYVHVLYQGGEGITPGWWPGRGEESIEAMVQVKIHLGILPGVPDASLQERRDLLVTDLLTTYQGNAFRYEPQSVARKETA